MPGLNTDAASQAPRRNTAERLVATATAKITTAVPSVSRVSAHTGTSPNTPVASNAIVMAHTATRSSVRSTIIDASTKAASVFRRRA